MDWQRVKERVTEEVLRQLQGDGGGTAAEKVRQMVVDALGASAGGAPGGVAAPAVAGPVAAPAAAGQATAGAVALAEPPAPVAAVPALPACEVGSGFKTDLLAVVAGPVCDKVAAALNALAAHKKVTVVAGAASTRLAEMQACGQVICDGNEGVARRLVQGAGAIVVPVITTSTAAKVGSLIGDCLPSAVLVQAAILGKRAVLAKESLAAPPGAAWSVRRKVEEVISTLRTLGFAISDLSQITADAKSGKGVGGFVPGYTPHPAVLASRAAKAEAAAVALATRPGAAPATSGAGTAAAPEFDRALARMIDHTLLKPEATAEQVTKLCKEALEYSFFSVCVNPTWVPLCAKLLAGSPVKVCTVIGFPLGATSANAKALEANDAIARGAHEVDMVLNVGALKSGQYDTVLNDITAVVQAARGKALVKVILETGLLTTEEKVKACELAKQAGADFVKTSTGFGPGGATPEDIARMRKTVGPAMGVKASGGIRDFDTAQAMVQAGATRIGASASVNIVRRVKPQPAKDKY